MSTMLTVTVRAGSHHRRHCPVQAAVSADRLGPELMEVLSRSPLAGELIGGGGQYSTPCELVAAGAGAVLRFMLDDLAAGHERTYTLSLETTDADLPRGVDLVNYSDEVHIYIAGERFAGYVFNESVAKPYLGPIIGPYGDPITRLDPNTKEHPHHRSIWLGIGDVNGVDGWNEPADAYGRQLHRGFDNMISGATHGSFTSHNTWTTFDRTPLMDDRRTITVYNTPAEVRVIDFDVTFTAIYGPVTFGQTKEAGPLGVRVATSMTVTNGGKIENAVGSISEAETWGKRAHWCDYSGDVNGRRVGIAILDHPENDNHPAYWHVRDYGLMAPNNLYFAGPVKLEKGDSLAYRYRLIFHAGEAVEADIAGRYQDYLNPPAVEVK